VGGSLTLRESRIRGERTRTVTRNEKKEKKEGGEAFSHMGLGGKCPPNLQKPDDSSHRLGKKKRGQSKEDTGEKKTKPFISRGGRKEKFQSKV